MRLLRSPWGIALLDIVSGGIALWDLALGDIVSWDFASGGIVVSGGIASGGIVVSAGIASWALGIPVFDTIVRPIEEKQRYVQYIAKRF